MRIILSAAALVLTQAAGLLALTPASALALAPDASNQPFLGPPYSRLTESLSFQRAVDESIGKRGDPDVFFVDGRLISLRLVTHNAGTDEKSAWADRLAVTDVTSGGNHFIGRVFGLGWSDPTPLALSDHVGAKRYILEIVPDGKRRRITFKRPDGKVPRENADHAAASITVEELEALRLKRAMKGPRTRGRNGEKYLAVPQYTSQFCWQLFAAESVAAMHCTGELPPNPFEPPKNLPK